MKVRRRLAMHQYLILLIILSYVSGRHQLKVRTRLDSGWVCGLVRHAQDGSEYASFRGVPYAKQPLGELRFKELQSVEPWRGCLDATVEGPSCPRHRIYFHRLLKPRGISEACIFANIHVPIHERNGLNWYKRKLPIVVFIHGGPWVDGSGDSDFNGPEYLVSKNVILITFNFRMDVLGFLSLNTSKIPGNNGLRDMVTLLRWVQTNARYFGGDPDDVTLAGSSAGGTAAQLLSLSPVTRGLFKRLWITSGFAIESYYTTAPKYSQEVASAFLNALCINSTNYDEIHYLLVRLPLKDIMRASLAVLSQRGFVSFVPVVESALPNVTPLITDDPEVLIAQGRGNSIPLVIGYTDVEAETFRRRQEEINIVERFAKNPLVVLPARLQYRYPADAQAVMAKKIAAKYFGCGPPTIDQFVKWATETYFAYPALKLTRARVASGGAPVYLYKFCYDTQYSVFKIVFGLNFTGGGHFEDINRILKVNSVPVPASSRDDSMTDWMSGLFATYIKYGCVPWPAEEKHHLGYQNISSPQLSYIPLTGYDRQMMEFFDNLTNV